MITYHVGDATQPDLDGRLVIAHVLSDTGAYGAGFAAAIARRHPKAKQRFQSWAAVERSSEHARIFRLGAVQWVSVGHDLGRRHPWWGRWILNMVAQHGLASKTNPHPLELDALTECLTHLADSGERTVVMPRIGCGLAGGTWGEVEPIIETTLSDVDVHIYDLHQPKPTPVRPPEEHIGPTGTVGVMTSI